MSSGPHARTSPLTERLLKVQPRVAERLVAQAELLLRELHAPAEALRDAEPVLAQLARELEADAVERRAALGVDPEARRQLGDDRPEVPRFEPCRGRERVAVHGVADPRDGVAGLLNRGDVRGEMLFNLGEEAG